MTTEIISHPPCPVEAIGRTLETLIPTMWAANGPAEAAPLEAAIAALEDEAANLRATSLSGAVLQAVIALVEARAQRGQMPADTEADHEAALDRIIRPLESALAVIERETGISWRQAADGYYMIGETVQ